MIPIQNKACTKCWYIGKSIFVKESFWESMLNFQGVPLRFIRVPSSSWSVSNWTKQSTQRSLRHCVVWMHFMACNTTKWAPTSHKLLRNGIKAPFWRVSSPHLPMYLNCHFKGVRLVHPRFPNQYFRSIRAPPPHCGAPSLRFFHWKLKLRVFLPKEISGSFTGYP